MQKIDDVLLKELELNILKNIAEFCDKNKMRYYLCRWNATGSSPTQRVYSMG